MKNFVKTLLCLYLILFFQISIASELKKTIQINTNSQFCQSDLQNWMPATVPGTVHTDLLKNKKIGDPFDRDMEKYLQWISNYDWDYQTTFDIDPVFFKNLKINS